MAWRGRLHLRLVSDLRSIFDSSKLICEQASQTLWYLPISYECYVPRSKRLSTRRTLRMKASLHPRSADASRPLRLMTTFSRLALRRSRICLHSPRKPCLPDLCLQDRIRQSRKFPDLCPLYRSLHPNAGSHLRRETLAASQHARSRHRPAQGESPSMKLRLSCANCGSDAPALVRVSTARHYSSTPKTSSQRTLGPGVIRLP